MKELDLTTKAFDIGEGEIIKPTPQDKVASEWNKKSSIDIIADINVAIRRLYEPPTIEGHKERRLTYGTTQEHTDNPSI